MWDLVHANAEMSKQLKARGEMRNEEEQESDSKLSCRWYF